MAHKRQTHLAISPLRIDEQILHLDRAPGHLNPVDGMPACKTDRSAACGPRENCTVPNAGSRGTTLLPQCDFAPVVLYAFYRIDLSGRSWPEPSSPSARNSASRSL